MRHERVTPTNYFPFKIFLFEAKDMDRLISTHWHDSSELIYCVEGNLNARILSETYQLKDNDVLFINSNTPHSTWSPAENKVLIMQFPLAFMKKTTLGHYDESKKIQINPSAKNTNKNIYIKISEILTKIVESYSNSSEKYFWEIMSLTYELFGIFTINFLEEVPEEVLLSQSQHLKKLKNIEEYIQKHYQEDLSLKVISHKFGFNPSYFSRFFKKHMGINYSNYLKSYRLEKGYYLLRDTDLSIIDIAFEVGFNSSKTFTNAFKEQFGMPPNQYKRKLF